jgi:hypothetical protein
MPQVQLNGGYQVGTRGNQGRGRPGFGKGNQGQGATTKPGRPNPQARAQVVALNRVDSNASAFIEGKILTFCKKARVLIDLGSTHSFIATPFTCTLELDSKVISCDVIVSTPLGKQLGSNIHYKDCEIGLGSVTLMGDLIRLPIEDYDAILEWTGCPGIMRR